MLLSPLLRQLLLLLSPLWPKKDVNMLCTLSLSLPLPLQFSPSSHARPSHESNFSVYTKAPFRSMCCDCDLPPSVARIVGGCSSSSNSNSSKRQATFGYRILSQLRGRRQLLLLPASYIRPVGKARNQCRHHQQTLGLYLPPFPPFSPLSLYPCHHTCVASANNANCANVQAKFWRQILLFFDQ